MQILHVVQVAYPGLKVTIARRASRYRFLSFPSRLSNDCFKAGTSLWTPFHVKKGFFGCKTVTARLLGMQVLGARTLNSPVSWPCHLVFFPRLRQTSPRASERVYIIALSVLYWSTTVQSTLIFPRDAFMRRTTLYNGHLSRVGPCYSQFTFHSPWGCHLLKTDS